MTKKKYYLGKFYERPDGSSYINIRKGADVPIESKTNVKILKVGDGLIIRPIT